jgi:hypothetical protein
MPDLNIRNIDQSLLRDINIAAAKAEVTQRDYVIQALTKCVGWEKEHGKAKKPDKSEPVERAEPVVADARGVGEDFVAARVTCRRCDAVVQRDPRPGYEHYWKCLSCRRQLDESEVKIWT